MVNVIILPQAQYKKKQKLEVKIEGIMTTELN